MFSMCKSGACEWGCSREVQEVCPLISQFSQIFSKIQEQTQDDITLIRELNADANFIRTIRAH